MTTRTLKILGLAYTPGVIEITANENIVFSGEVPWSNTTTLSSPLSTLCSFDLESTFSGPLSMTCRVNEGLVYFANILTNYGKIKNPRYTEEQHTILNDQRTSISDKTAMFVSAGADTLSLEEINILNTPSTTDDDYVNIIATHQLSPLINGGADVWDDISNHTENFSDPRTEIKIDGISQAPVQDDMLYGAWWWKVPAGSTLSYILTVPSILI